MRRWPALAAERRINLTDLSALIDQGPRYLQRFVKEGVPERRDDHARATLSAFFGVTEHELGGDNPRWAKFAVAE